MRLREEKKIMRRGQKRTEGIKQIIWTVWKVEHPTSFIAKVWGNPLTSASHHD